MARGRMPLESMQSFCVFRPHFDEIENFIQDNQASKVKMAMGLDLLVRTMAMVTRGYAQKRSAGPIAPRQRSVPALAYRIPVQRITGAYFAGWTMRRLGVAHWLVYNDSREAYLIETGMYMRSRRPIAKLALIDMLKFLQTTRTADRFLDWVIAPRRNSRGQFQSFATRMAGTATLGGMAGPQGRLPK